VIVFVGSYGPTDDATIHICVLDEATGELRGVGAASGIGNPSFLAVAPDGRHLYAVSETGLTSDGIAGRVHAIRVDLRGHAVELSPVNDQPSGGDHPCHLGIDASGRWLVVSNYGTGSVAVLPIRHDGSLGEIVSLAHHAGEGPNRDRQDRPHAHATTFTPDGRYLIAADLGADRLFMSAFDSHTGSLRPHRELGTSPGAGPRHIVVHPGHEHLLVVNELDSTLTLYGYDADAGALRDVVTLPTLPPGAPESVAADVRVAPDGRHLYVSNRGDDSVAVFAFDRGRLTRVAVRPCGGAWPRGLGLGPNGNHVLVANQHSDDVVVLPVLDGGSDLGEPVARLRIPRATCVAFADERSPRGCSSARAEARAVPQPSGPE
jgi:6-phosphogluconolactonase